MATTYNQARVDTRQVVYDDDSLSPIAGPASTDNALDVDGWKYNDRLWTDEKYENFNQQLPALADAPVAPLGVDLLQSGSIGKTDACKVLEAVPISLDSEVVWGVDIQTGGYYKYNFKRHLFSNAAVAQNYVKNVELELEFTAIPKDCSPILARIWERGEYREPMVYKEVIKRTEFAEDGIPEMVLSWPNGEDEPPLLTFGDDYTFLIGPATSDADLQFLERIGSGNGEADQLFFTRYFPIDSSDPSELKIYVDTYSGVLTELQYSIDMDRGEILFDLGYNPPDGAILYMAYRPTFEVQYEPFFADNIRTESELIDLDPLHSTTNQGFIYLTERELQVASLTLEAETEAIDSDAMIYGPLALGSDYCTLVATALNAFDQPVPGVDVTFHLPTTGEIGAINGGRTAIGRTDENGEARVTYTTARLIETVGQYTYHPAEEGDSDAELRIDTWDGITEDNLDTIYTFRVYDDDTLQPWGDEEGGRKVVIYMWSATAINPHTGEAGAYVPIRPVAITSHDGINYLSYPAGSINDTVTYGGIVAYWVVSCRDIQCYATAENSLYNTTITSNNIYLRLSLPEYMTGSYVVDDVETPYGFRIFDGQHTVASAINGATFLTIQPQSAARVWPVLWDGEQQDDLFAENPFANAGLQGFYANVSIV